MRKNIFLLIILNCVAIFSLFSQTITTVVGGGTGGLGNGGPATDASIGYLSGIVVDKMGYVFLGDGNNQTVRVVDPHTHIISVFAGTGTLASSYSADGIIATSADLFHPNNISLDHNGNLYIVDRFKIRKVDRVTHKITTVVGTGLSGTSGDGGPASAATIDGAVMAWDTNNNLYLTSRHRIRKVNSMGIISTIIGTGIGGVVPDTVAALSANITVSLGIAVDNEANIFFQDTTGAIRKFDISSGLVYRVAGTGNNVVTPYSGDGTYAKDCHIGPMGIAVDDTGNVYISDYVNSRIEKVNKFGKIYTIAGNGMYGYSGDGGDALQAKISYPQNVTLDKCNNIYIADFVNRRVRKVTYRECDYTSVQDAPVVPKQIEITPSPAKSAITITSESSIHTLAIYNLLGQVVLQQAGSGKPQQQIDVSTLPPGVYILRVNDVWTARLVKD